MVVTQRYLVLICMLRVGVTAEPKQQLEAMSDGRT